jgi:AraC-like DNA-binding protein
MAHGSPVQMLDFATLQPGRSDGHPYTVGVLLRSGSMDVQLSTKFTVRAGELYIVPAQAAHALHGVSEGATGWGFRLSPQLAAGSKRTRAIPMEATDADDLEAWLRRIHGEQERADACSLAMKDALLQAVHVQCARAINGGYCGTRSPMIARALAIIQSESSSPLRPRDVAERIGVSAAHLSHEFSRQTGKSPSEWIATTRMDAARRELLLTRATVSTVAERVGFADVSQFHRHFRRSHGMTPDAWRRANAKESTNSQNESLSQRARTS